MIGIILSFIIPTYNRPLRIKNLLTQILSIQSNEIEVVIGDDNPNFQETEQVVKSFNDQRIKYLRNKKNLGMDGNMLRCIRNASGKFVFIQMDDDDIEVENIPWIIHTIKQNDYISQICGILGDKRPSRDKPIQSHNQGNKMLRKGYESIKKLLFHYHHGSGIVLRRDALNLKKATKSIWSFWMQQTLIAQAMLAGDTLCTQKVFAYFGEIELEPSQTYSHLKRIGHIHYEKFRLQIVYDVLKQIKSKKLKKVLLNRRKSRILYCFMITKSLQQYLHDIGVILTTRLALSISFWIFLSLNTLFYFISEENKIKWFVNMFNKYYLKE